MLTISYSRIAAYIRVSTVEQAEKGYSIDAQLENIKSFCEENQYLLTKTYIDRGISGVSTNGRHALQQMLDDAKLGLFDELVVWKVNRLSRKMIDLLEIIETLQKYNISFRSISEKFETNTALGKFTMQMIGAVGQLERETIIENTKLGRSQRSKTGKYCGARIYGYNWPVGEHTGKRKRETKLVINEVESAVVQQVFSWYSDGLGYKAILNRLNQMGVRTKDRKEFSVNTIRTMLNNSVYTGRVQYTHNQQKHLVDGEHEAIIPNDLWCQVQKKLKSSSRLPLKQIDRSYPLSSILKCPECKSSMIGRYIVRKRVNGEKIYYYYYYCSKYANKGSATCHANSVNAENIEKQVNLMLERLLKQFKVNEDVINVLDAKAGKGIPEDTFIKKPRSQENKDRLLKKQKMLMKQFEVELIDQEKFIIDLQRIKAELISLEKEEGKRERVISINPPKQEMVGHMIAQIFKEVKQVNLEKYKKLMKRLFKYIHLNKNHEIEKIALNIGDAEFRILKNKLEKVI